MVRLRLRVRLRLLLLLLLLPRDGFKPKENTSVGAVLGGFTEVISIAMTITKERQQGP